MGKLQFLIKKKFNFFSAVIFFQFLVIKALDPDQMNTDPKPCHKRKFRVSYPDPDSIRSVDQDPDLESESGSRREKITHKNRKKLGNFMLLSAGCSLFRAEGYFCSLDVLYRGLELTKTQF